MMGIYSLDVCTDTDMRERDDGNILTGHAQRSDANHPSGVGAMLSAMR